jgi:RNA polymerase sigma-70 factor, ECF subfamily
MQSPTISSPRAIKAVSEAPLSSSDEAALLAAARSDPAAFAELYRRYVTRVYRYLYSHVGQSDDAEDLTAQVFTAAWQGLARYQERGNFTAWLFQIARNKTNDFYRRRRPQLSLEAAGAALRVDWDPLASVERRETLHRLSELVNRLEPDQRELIRLRFAADLSFAEIAALLGRSEAAVKMTLHRLLRNLQGNWEVRDV